MISGVIYLLSQTTILHKYNLIMQFNKKKNEILLQIIKNIITIQKFKPIDDGCIHGHAVKYM